MIEAKCHVPFSKWMGAINIVLNWEVIRYHRDGVDPAHNYFPSARPRVLNTY